MSPPAPDRVPLRWQLVAMLTTGSLFAWSFPPYDRWPLIFVALVPILCLAGQVPPRRFALLGGGASLVGSAWLVPWLFKTLEEQFTLTALGAGLAFALLLLWYACPWVLCAWAIARAHNNTTRWAPLASVVILTATDTLRGAIDPFGLYLPAHALAAEARMVQLVAWLGETGLSLWVYGVAALGAGLFHACCRRHRRSILRFASAAFGAFLAGLLANIAASPSTTSLHERSVRVGLVQVDGAVGGMSRLDSLVRASAELVRREAPDLLLWPEGALAGAPAADEQVLRPLWEAMAGHNVTLLTGGLRQTLTHGQPATFNSVFAIHGAGVVVGQTDKQVLVPFGEYAPPIVGLLGLSKAQQRHHFGSVQLTPAGVEPRPLRVSGVATAPLVCNEILIPRLAQRAAEQGADLLVNVSNDRWAQRQEVAQIMVRAARLRAIQTRLPVVRSAAPGGLVAFDRAGKLLFSAPWHTPVASVIEVPLARTTHGQNSVEFWLQGLLGISAVGAVIARTRTTAARSSRPNQTGNHLR